MTKVQIRFRLERPLDEQLMPQIALAHSVYGLIRIQLEPSTEEIVVEYDASRLRPADVGAQLKLQGIPVILEK